MKMRNEAFVSESGMHEFKRLHGGLRVSILSTSQSLWMQDCQGVLRADSYGQRSRNRTI
jgi:hypothetical protein